MFQPSREDVRRFFCEAWAKHLGALGCSPLEKIAISCMLEHPEYHALLADPRQALEQDYPVESGRQNPFLHLSMHLALEEQASIDQPPGVRQLLERLQLRCGGRHEAAHEAMECLGQVIWSAQRGTLAPDIGAINQSYIECLERRLSR